MTTHPMIDQAATSRSDLSPRVWRLQYGPCWCHSTPTESSAFDYVRMRSTVADLGALEENLLIVSERVIDGTANAFRRIHASVPDPKLVISAGTCPASHRFWDELPNGWILVQEVLAVDIRVEECVSGYPEALVAAVLGHVFERHRGGPGRSRDHSEPEAITVGSAPELRDA